MIRLHSQLPGGTRACDRERGMRAMRVAREGPQLLPLRVPGEGRLTSIYLATDKVERALRRSADFSLRFTYYLLHSKLIVLSS